MRIYIVLLLVFGSNILLAQTSKHERLFPKIDSLLESYYEADKPGGIISILKNGEVLYTNGIGTANLEYDIPISDSTAFHIASVSKQFTGFLAASFEEEGKLQLDDDIRMHLPELKQFPTKISIRQLANHTHGLPNLFELAQLKGIDFQEKMTHREVVAMLLSLKSTNFKAGEKYEYNNTGYALLAEIIERIDGRPFGEIVADRIFIPLGMKNSEVVGDPTKLIKNKAYSYRLSGEEYEHFPIGLMANGASGISTTIQDLGRWANNFHTPIIGSKSLYQKMTAFSTLNSDATIPYGLGLESKKYKGLDIVFHGGGDAAYRAYMLHAPQHEFSVVILSNSGDFSSLDISYAVLDLFLAEYQTAPIAAQPIKYTHKALKQLEGTYEMFPGTFYNIIAQNDSLFFQSFGSSSKAPLPVISENVFDFPYVPHSKFVFYEGGFNFHIADFKYACKKVDIQLPKDLKLQDFEGRYRNEELKITYELVIKKDALWAISDVNPDIRLYPLSESSFYSNTAYFGQLEFSRDAANANQVFLLSGNFLKGLKFVRME